MKKIFGFIFAVCLTVVLTVSVSAASNKLGAAAPAGELKAGDTVKVTVSLSTEDAFKSIGLTMKYDSNAFTLESGKWILKGMTLKDVNVSRNQAVAAFTSEKTVKDDIFEFTLKVKSGAYTDSYTVTVEPVLKNGPNAVAVDGASVTVKVNGVARPTGSEPVASNGVSSVDASSNGTSETTSSSNNQSDVTSSGDNITSDTASEPTVSDSDNSSTQSGTVSDNASRDDISNPKDTDGASSRMTLIIVLVAVIAAVAVVVVIIAVRSKKK